MRSREFAVWAHAGQKYGEEPYVAHLDEVAATVAQYMPDGDDDDFQDAAYLHDVVEDTPVTRSFVEEMFGVTVATAVEFLTDPEAPNRKERKRKLHDRLSRLDANRRPYRLALAVKAADRLSNVKRCVEEDNGRLLQMYAKEHPDFRAAVHRDGLCDNLWKELDELVARR